MCRTVHRQVLSKKMKVGVVLRRYIQFLREAASAPPDTVWNSGPADILFMSADANKPDSISGLAVDRVLDPLRLEFERQGYKTATVAFPGSQLVGKKTFSGALSFSRQLLWRRFFLSLNIIFVKVGVKPISSIDLDYANFFERVFLEIKPKLILMTNSYDGCCEAAYASRIPILEVLHARGYGELGEAQRLTNLCSLPDGIIAMDGLSAATFSELVPTLKVSNYRFPFELENALRFLKFYPPPFVNERNIYRNIILFTASYDPRRPSWPGGLPEELIQIVRRDHSLFLLVRMHPVMRVERKYRKAREKLKQLLEDCGNSDIEWASEAPVYAALEASTIHLTVESSTAYEAADVGLKTYAIDKGSRIHGNHKQDLKKAGILMTIKTDHSTFANLLSAPAPRFKPSTPDTTLNIKQVMNFADFSSQARWTRLFEIANAESD